MVIGRACPGYARPILAPADPTSAGAVFQTVGKGRVLLTFLALLVLLACGDGPSGPTGQTRSYRMGFSAIPPRNDQTILLQALELWSQRADAAIMHVSVPWAVLLDGISATEYVQQTQVGLANYYRAKNLTIVMMLDPTDGLNRSAEAPELIALGRSIREPAIQALYRAFAVAMATIIRPTYLGLAAETNLIRASAPPELYQALVPMITATAPEVRTRGFTGRIFVSVQVEVAWGFASSPPGAYVGIAQDLQDFAFVDAIGLSSYPYFVHARPEDLPSDYYARIANEAARPVLVVEGGWTSTPVGSAQGTPEQQARYVTRQAALLAASEAEFVFQLTFTDLDLVAFPPGVAPFASLGLVNTNLQPKLALEVWDSLFALARSP